MQVWLARSLSIALLFYAEEMLKHGESGQSPNQGPSKFDLPLTTISGHSLSTTDESDVECFFSAMWGLWWERLLHARIQQVSEP